MRAIKNIVEQVARKETRPDDKKKNHMDFLNNLLSKIEDGEAGPMPATQFSDVGLDDFELLKVLGKGSFGKVMLAQKKDDGKIYAIKILKKEVIIERNELEHLMTEKNVLSLVQHPFLVHLMYAFQDQENLYFVMVRCCCCAPVSLSLARLLPCCTELREWR